MDELAELLERYRRGAELVAASLTGVAGPMADYRPAEGKWSIRQIVTHLADSEMVSAFRFRRIIAEDDPAIEAYDQDAWADKLDYSKKKVSAALELFRRIRSDNYELLKDLPPEAWSRTCRHSERGTLSLYELLKIYATHAEKHTVQIRTVREAWSARPR